MDLVWVVSLLCVKRLLVCSGGPLYVRVPWVKDVRGGLTGVCQVRIPWSMAQTEGVGCLEGVSHL